MNSLDLISVNELDENRLIILVDVTDDNGDIRRLSHVLPRNTIEWRAAEYDLHPIDDYDELLDMVLFEPHVDVPEDKRLYRAESPEIAKQTMKDAIKVAKNKSDGQKAKRKPNANAPDEAEIRRQIGKLSWAHPITLQDKKEAVAHNHDVARMPVSAPNPVESALLRKEMEKKKNEKMSHLINEEL